MVFVFFAEKNHKPWTNERRIPIKEPVKWKLGCFLCLVWASMKVAAEMGFDLPDESAAVTPRTIRDRCRVTNNYLKGHPGSRRKPPFRKMVNFLLEDNGRRLGISSFTITLVGGWQHLPSLEVYHILNQAWYPAWKNHGASNAPP